MGIDPAGPVTRTSALDANTRPYHSESPRLGARRDLISSGYKGVSGQKGLPFEEFR